MRPAGAVRLVPRGQVYKQIFEAEVGKDSNPLDHGSLKVQLVRSLDEVRNRRRFLAKSGRLPLVRDAEAATDARLLPHSQQHAEGTSCGDSPEQPPLYREATTFPEVWQSVAVTAAEEVRGLPDAVVSEERRSNIAERLSELRRGRHEEALASMGRELASIGREMEPFVLEPAKFLLTKLMESDRKIELLFEKIESDVTVEGFSFEGLEELWNIVQQESLTRKKWIREMDESLKKVERNRVDKITEVLRKYTVKLEDIAFLLSADVYRLVNDEAMLINRALLANQRAITKLFSNLMKSELKKELSHRWKWQDTVERWKLIQRKYVSDSFREFMASEEIQDPPAVKRELENMITGQILLSERRLELLQHLGALVPPAHTKAKIEEWHRAVVSLNRSVETHNVQCMKKIRAQYEMVQQKCLAEAQLHKDTLLNLRVCTTEEAEEMVNSELLQLTEKPKSLFEEELEQMGRDFEELAKQTERSCGALYSYAEEAMGLWDVHQHRLSQQEGELQKRLDECKWKQDNLMQTVEAKLDIILDEMRTADSEENLKKYLKNALSSLDDIRAGNETFNQVLTDEVTTYPEAILQELISYSVSVSQYFSVKEIFKQNLQGEIDFTFRDQGNTSTVQTDLVEASEAEHLVEQQVESIVQENEGEEMMDSCQQEHEEKKPDENEEIFAQETEEKEGEEEGESSPRASGETEPAEQGEGKLKALKMAVETFSTSSGNSYTVLGVEDLEKSDIPETNFTKYEKEESFPMYLKYVLIKETVFVELKKRIRLCFFEHLEKWFAESLSNSCVFVAARKEELNSDLQLQLHLHQQRQENVETSIYNLRAEELLAHKEHLECHCAGVVEALEKERAEFLKFCDQQNTIRENLHSQIRDMEAVFLSAAAAGKLVSFSKSVHSELQNQLGVIQVSLRSYRSYLEEALGNLRDSNEGFLKACRLFLEGGNFSPEEVNCCSKRLEGESKRIDSFESVIKTDLEKVESSSLGQATELINQSEEKFHYLLMNQVFMEKIRRFLSHLRVQIKAEVANSNFQAATINSYLEKLRQKTDACAHPTADKKALTSEELYDFVKVVLKELKKRSQYLDCLLVKVVSPRDTKTGRLLKTSPLARDIPLQGPIAVAIRTERLRDENGVMVMGLDPVKFPVLNPSQMGKSALNDLSISVIKNLLDKSSGSHQKGHKHSRSGGPGVQKSASHSYVAQISKKSSVEKKRPTRKKQKARPVLSHKKLLMFGEKPPESDTFKGIIMNILWAGNNDLLCLAEEFYRTGKPQLRVPEDLPKTFEGFAEMLKQKLLPYQTQTEVYYNSCLIEFREQLKLFEEELPSICRLAVHSLLQEHEQKLSYSTGRIWHLFSKQLEDWENAKAVHKNQLHTSLGHPDNFLQLDALCQEEIKRQKAQADGIHLHTQMLQDCAAECAQNFVSALAAFTEKLLLELDESVTIDDVQVAKTEVPREKTATLIHRRQAGLPLENREVTQLIQRGGRTWRGIPVTTLTDNSDYIVCRETASVTTAKSTLGHAAVVEARDAVYEKYKSELEEQFAQIKKESTAQLLRAQRWEDWWKRSIQKIKHLYS